MAKVLLTDRNVLTRGEGRTTDAKSRGLSLHVRATSRIYEWRFTWEGKTVPKAIGPVDKVSLAEARRLADEWRGMVARGIDPRTAKAPSKAVLNGSTAAIAVDPELTFMRDAERWFEFKRRTWSKQHGDCNVWSPLTRFAFPLIGDRDSASLTTADIVAVLKPIWADTPTVAERLFLSIRQVLEHAILQEGGDERFPRGNVARRALKSSELPEGHKPVAVPHPAPTLDELRALYATLCERPEPEAVALRLLILTQTPRTSEVVRARCGEFLTGAALWTVPAVRVKGRVTDKQTLAHAHQIPLGAAAVALLESILPADAKPDEFLFKGRGGHWNSIAAGRRARAGKAWPEDYWTPYTGCMKKDAMQDLMRDKLGLPWHVHGIRSTFTNWMEEVHPEMDKAVKLALAHTTGSKVDRAYNRTGLIQQRRDLANEWASVIGA